MIEMPLLRCYTDIIAEHLTLTFSLNYDIHPVMFVNKRLPFWRFETFRYFKPLSEKPVRRNYNKPYQMVSILDLGIALYLFANKTYNRKQR